MASTINSSTSNGIVITPDTSGEIELQANGVTKAKVTANGLQDANGNSLRGGSYRNLIINGDMRIDQRNAGSAVSFGYIVDRFIATGTGSLDEVVRSYQQVSDAPNGFDYSSKLTITTAETAFTDTEHIGLAQRIEGQNVAHLQWGTANAKTVTLSFWVKSSLTGTFSGVFQNSARDRSYPFEYTISSADTWEYKTVTISGDTTGTWLKDNGIGIRVNFNHGCGPDRKGTVDTWAGADYRASSTQTVELGENLNATWQITGLQLEVGEGASDFEFLPYDVQLQRCQRYYQDFVTDQANMIGEAISTTRIVWGGVFLPCEMRATPTTTVHGANGLAGYVSGYNAVSHYNGGFTMVGMTRNGGGQRSDGSAVLTTGVFYQCRLTLEAEL